MRPKNLISPEKPALDVVKYKFKLLFLPFTSFFIAGVALTAFVCEFIELVRGTIGNHITFDLIYWSFCIIILPPLFTWLIIKISDILITSEGIFGLNLVCRRTYINWQEIALVKPYQILGMRCLSIKTAFGKNIHFGTRFYNTRQIVDRVRALAGEDHLLVRALEKELSRPRYELTKLWCGVIGSIALTMSIYLIGGNMYAAEQEKPLEQAIATYVRQHPKTAPNQSAIDLQTLMAKLGLSVEGFGDGTEVKVKPDQAAIAEWKAIEPIFKK